MNRPAILRLYLVELRRVAHRRATRVIVGVMVALLVLIGVKAFLGSSAAPPDMAAAEATAAAQVAECRQAVTADGTVFSERDLSDMCFVDPQWFVVDTSFHLQSLLGGNGQQEWSVARMNSVGRSSYEIDTSGTVRVNPADGFGGELVTVAILMGFVAAGLGASHVGADWRSGMMETHAIWAPGRRRLLAAKLAAAGTAGAVLSLLASVGFIAVLVPSVLWRGDAAGTGSGFAMDAATTTGRAALAAGLFAVLAASIAAVARNTVAGMAGIFGWSIVATIIADYFGAWVAYLSPYGNLKAFVSRGDVAFSETVRLSGGGTESFMAISHGWFAAGLVAAVLVAIAISLAETSFAHRDIS